jgi:hypothetical protein
MNRANITNHGWDVNRWQVPVRLDPLGSLAGGQDSR